MRRGSRSSIRRFVSTADMRKEPTRLVTPASNDGRKRTRVVTFVGVHRMACDCAYEQWLLDTPS